MLSWGSPTSSAQKQLRSEFTEVCASSPSLCPAFHMDFAQPLYVHLQLHLLQALRHSWSVHLPVLTQTLLCAVRILVPLCSCAPTFRFQRRSHFLQEEDFPGPQIPTRHLFWYLQLPAVFFLPKHTFPDFRSNYRITCHSAQSNATQHPL